MNSEIQPPRSLPLRVMGWMSLPWRHWIYIVGTLLFGLIFITIAPFPFLVRVVVLLIPFFTALGLAVPYGGLHMDEWILLAVKYRMRPTAATISYEELKGQGAETLEALLDVSLEVIASDAPEPLRIDEPLGAEEQWPATSGWIPGAQQTTPPRQIYLAGTHGILRRGYGRLPDVAPPSIPLKHDPSVRGQALEPEPNKPKKRRLW